jgi:hypothetical protein
VSRRTQTTLEPPLRLKEMGACATAEVARVVRRAYDQGVDTGAVVIERAVIVVEGDIASV